MRKYGHLERVLTCLKENGIKTVVYDKIQPNPVTEHVEEGAAVAKENRCDFVLGLGGGSTLDSAKSIAVMAVNPGRYWDYITRGSGGRKTPPNGALRHGNRSRPLDRHHERRHKREDRLGKRLDLSATIDRRSGADGERSL
jgi:hypothetical protein